MGADVEGKAWIVDNALQEGGYCGVGVRFFRLRLGGD